MDRSPNSWSVLQVKKCPNTKTSVLGPANIVLDCVVSYNVDMQVRNRKKAAKIVLSGVPGFLIEAFDWLSKKDVLKAQGLFRKEGNVNRMRNAWRTLCGLESIPPDFTTNDVCSLIKRFFREITTPIFNDTQGTLIKFAEDLREERILLDSIFTVIERLPTSYMSTIAFLMRNLKTISDLSDENRMTIDNLATVFAPALFRDDLMAGSRTFSSSYGYGKQNNRGSDEKFLNYVRHRNDLQIKIINLLIQNSDLIGVNQICKLPNEMKLAGEVEENRLQRKIAHVTPKLPFHSEENVVSPEKRDLGFAEEVIREAKNVGVQRAFNTMKEKPQEPADKCIFKEHSTPIRQATLTHLPNIMEEGSRSFRKTALPKLPVYYEKKLTVQEEEDRPQRKTALVLPKLPVLIEEPTSHIEEKIESPKARETITFNESTEFKGSNVLMEQIMKSKTVKDLAFRAPTPAFCNRPSVAQFQMNNRGFVKERKAFFSNLK